MKVHKFKFDLIIHGHYFIWQLATADQLVAEVTNDSCRIKWGAVYLFDIMALCLRLPDGQFVIDVT